MFKPMIVAMAALAIAGSSIGYAQERFGGPGDEGDRDGGLRFEHHFRPTADDIKAFGDARIAALKAGLALTPDQEKNWPTFEQALRDLVTLRVERFKARQAAGDQPPPSDPFVRLQRRAEAMSQTAAALKHIADAGEPLYQSLNDAQKGRFKFLAHMLRPHWMAGGRFGQEHRHCMMRGDSDEGGMHGMMRGDLGRGGMQDMMSADDESGGPSMMGQERDDESDNL